MRVAFHKMHGLGNDFVVIDARAQAFSPNAAQARALCDRRHGVGCDQLILLEASDSADARMRIWNPDGGEVGACGNASRAVALLLGKTAQIETDGGVLMLTPADGGATVDLPAPRFEWDAVPLAYAMDTAALPLAWDELTDPAALNVGNPHLVFFVEDADTIDLARLGPVIENDAAFPERINVNVARVTGPSSVQLRTWERGAGLTNACGTGSCATAVAAIRARRAASPVTIGQAGGELVIAWHGSGPIRMTGPATHVFEGAFDTEALAA